MGLTFSEKLMIFFRFYLDLKYQAKELVLEEFTSRFHDLHGDLLQVVNGQVLEINGLYDGLEVMFKKEADQYRLFLRLRQDLALKFMAKLEVHSGLDHAKDKSEPDYDEVLRQSQFRLLPPGNVIEIKIKRGQAE